MVPEEDSSGKNLCGRTISPIHCLLGAPTILLGARSNSPGILLRKSSLTIGLAPIDTHPPKVLLSLSRIKKMLVTLKI